VAPVFEVPLLPLPPPFMLVPVSVPLELGLLVPPAGVLVAPLEVVESARGAVVLAVDSLPGALVEVLEPVSLPPQLLSIRLPSSNATRDKKGIVRCMEVLSEELKALRLR
jgi:hypothetical protein